MWWKMSVYAFLKSHHTANVDVKLNWLLHHLSGKLVLGIGLSYQPRIFHLDSKLSSLYSLEWLHLSSCTFNTWTRFTE